MADDGSFGVLLRQYRTARSLTQQRLAERAGVSTKAVAALEAGRRTAPRLSTVSLLVDALELEDAERVALVSAATSADRRNDGPAWLGPTVRTSEPVATRPAEFPGVVRQFPFVGRPAERRTLTDAWRRGVRVLLVSGEAGAGKTRLVGEFAASIADVGSVFWGRCTPERLGAYEPFVEPVRAAVSHADPSTLTMPMMGELERIVPELAAPGARNGPSIADPGVERRLLFDAVTSLFATAGRALFVVDDVQWADGGSLSLLAHLAASPDLHALMIVAAIRSTDLQSATAAALSDMRRHATLERLTLGGLRDTDVAELVREIADRDVSEAFIDAVIAATEGNPLFVAELTEHLLEQQWEPGANADSGDPRATPVPVGLRETLGHRLDTLSPTSQSLLRAGAVLGRTFATDFAAQVADLDEDHVLVATEEALDSDLVVEVSGRALMFSHALVQSAVYEAMSARRRLQLHRRAAVMLAAALPASRAEGAAVYDIARHWAAVAADDETALDEAVQWTVRAGDAAAAAADIGEAIRRYEWAARQWTEPSHERGRILLRLGNAHSARSDTIAADRQYWDVLELAADLDDQCLYADAAIGLAATVRFGHHDPARIEALERALRELPAEEHGRRVTAAAMLKRQLGFDPSDAAYRRRQVVARIVLDAVSADSLSTDLLTSLGAARDSIVVDDPIVLERVSRLMVETATAERNLSMLANALYGQAWAALELADGPGWRDSTTAFARVADELELPYELALAARMDAATALLEGRYDDAEKLGQRSLELAADVDPNAAAIQLTNAVMRGFDQGQAPEIFEVMLAARSELESVPTFMAGLALTAAFAGDPDLTREILDSYADVDYANLRKDLEWLPVIGLCAHACITIGDARYAQGLRDQLSRHPARAVRVGPLAAFWGPTDYYLGALSGLLGEADQAERLLRRAVETCVALGARPWTARTQIALADHLEVHGASERDEMAQLRSSARETATELGAEGIQP